MDSSAEIKSLFHRLKNELHQKLSVLTLKSPLYDWTQLQKLAHKLTSEAFLFHQTELHQNASTFEQMITDLIKNYPLHNQNLNKLQAAFQKIESSIAAIQDTMKDTKRKIVIVDDDEDIIHLLSYELKNLGVEVQSFANGKEALDFLLNEKNLTDVSLLILDRVLPDMDGLEILRQFYHAFPKKIPVLILSMLASEKDILNGLKTGAIDYVAKPFSVYLLLQKALNLMAVR